MCKRCATTVPRRAVGNSGVRRSGREDRRTPGRKSEDETADGRMVMNCQTAGVPNRMSPRPWLSLVAFAPAAAIVAGLLLYARRQPADDWSMPPPSPELRQFFARCAAVRPEMTDYQIDV